MTVTCGDCRFFTKSHDSDRRGLCRRVPPVVVATAHTTTTAFPAVSVDDWCGEFRPTELAAER